jgi:signal transduction histidine kinase
LTASAFTIDTARNVLPNDPQAADQLLAAVRAEVAAAIDDIRRLVYGLRPPALDELGLIGALRQHIARLDGSAGGLAVQVDAPDDLPSLPAAVEVAAFRIATEAVTNVARHSGARRCTLRIACNGDLMVEVRDDGSHAGDWQAGVGMASMRERAAEVGGVCEIGPTREGGGRVSARLPLHV